MSLTPSVFQKKLLAWFDAHGRKTLPWQQNKTPYRVWISEIMLQQTQVATVIPYYERFMTQFPDIVSLANANEDAVMHAWAGLGYYTRARNLHRAAKKVLSDFNGIFPSTVDDLEELPGIGRSTAGAIIALAFNQPATILDGNVKRVLARIHAIQAPINEKATEVLLWGIASRYTPTERIADYTQAMMDLGATLCTRSEPACSSCVFQKHCGAYLEDLVATLPAKTASKKLPVKTTTFLIIKHDNRVLLQKRPASGIWGGLFSLPELVGHVDSEAARTYCEDNLRLRISGIEPLKALRHTFSHYHLEIQPLLLSIKKVPAKAMEEGVQIWYNLQEPEAVGLPKPVQTILRGLA